MGSYAGQRRTAPSASGWIKFALLGVVVSICFQGALCEIEPTESQCRQHIEKALKEQHIEERTLEEGAHEDLINEQEENPPTDELTDPTEGSIPKDLEGKDDEGDGDDDGEVEKGDDGDDGEVEKGEEDGDGEVEKGEEDGDEEVEKGDDDSEGEVEKEDDNGDEDAKTEDEDEVETDGEDEKTEDENGDDNVEETEEEDAEKDEVEAEAKEGGEDDDAKEDAAEDDEAEAGDDKHEDSTKDDDDKEDDEKEVDKEDGEKEVEQEGGDDAEDDAESTLDRPIEVEVHEVEMDDDNDDEDKEQGPDGDEKDDQEGDEEKDEKDEGDGKDEKDEDEGKGVKDEGDGEDEKVEDEEKDEKEEDEKDDGVEKEEGDDGDDLESKVAQKDDDKKEEEEEEKEEEDDKKEKEEDTEDDNKLEKEDDDDDKADKVEDKDNDKTDDKKDGDEEEDKEEVEGKIEKREAKESEAEGAAESEDAEDVKEEGDQESTPEEEELIQEVVIPDNLRPRDHISKILKLEDSDTETILEKAIDTTLKSLKGLYDSAIKPLEMLYKYRDLSNRHFGDPEIFSKPLILFMGPWSGGKSSTINYLLDNEFSHTSLRTGAEPSPAYFNILMHGEEEEILDGTQLAADWTFSGLQKFGQGLLDRLKGIRLPNKLLEKVNIVEIPGILEIRKQVQRLFPFNDACQWFIDRADIIFLVYDPSKLDVGPETEAILDQLKGREYQTRIILNKADQVKPEELMRVQGTLIWNISPLMSSSEPPIMYSTSLWSMPYESGAPTRLLLAQERAFLRDLREAVDKRVENKIASARRFAVRVRNHAKMVDCYLTTYYNHKSFFGNRKKISDDIIEYPQKYHIYEGLSTLTNISRYDLPDPDVYRDFFKINPLYDFKKLSETCTYFRGCPINKLDVAIAYELPELVGKYKKAVEAAKEQLQKENS